MKKITLQTKDNKKIAALFYETKKPAGWIVYSHMMPATKESYASLASALLRRKYGGIAIDLRGHGESEGGPDGYKKFTDEEHQSSIYDLKAAVGFLGEKGALPQNTFFIGASIGANLSLLYLANNELHKKAVLLSAGLNYRGIKTDELISRLRPDQYVLLVSSKDDGTNAEDNQKLFNLAPYRENVILKIFDTGGHGTHLIDHHPELIEEIAEFLAS